ncbi:MAG: Protein YeeZ [Candidatus Celerinatantimonas neptuna]|nr:MAG: Protein YeeZ [Candidatus Celerinatantimonas neptuna]
MPQQIKQIAIVGCGWLGTPLAYHLLGLGYGVRGTRQHTSSRIELAQAGVIEGALSVTPELHCDVSEKIFGGCDLLIINIPPNRKAHDRHYHVTQIQSLAQAAVNYQIPKVLFIGSTSVYGPMQGEVTESSPAQPSTQSGQTLLEIEQWLHQQPSFVTTTLRFGGMIGPGRHPGRFLSGRQVDGADTPVNLIHQADCIALIDALIQRNIWGEVFNACADEHPSRCDFYSAAAKQLDVEMPQFNHSQNSSKFISNQAIKDALRYSFIYPDPIAWLKVQEKI